MASVNKVIILGYLGTNPETRYTQSGDAVTNVSVATTERWKDKDGEKQEKTEWHSVVLFGRQAEVAGEYLQKGSLAYFEGKLQTRKYTDKEGVERYKTEVVAERLQLMPRGDRNGEKPDPKGKPSGAKTSSEKRKASADFDDDIPF